ncbi:MAG: DUF3244 domain-containing protein [Prevotella sp.]|nr:DUF3244 domain-containing protein [Prevotella sp.]
MNVKKLTLILFMSLVGFVNMGAETREIIYSIDYNDGSGKPRSVRKKPLCVYQSDENIILSPEWEQYVHVTISDKNGDEVKNESAILIPGQDTLLYIGDLAAGMYELTIETGGYTLHGSFEVE